MNPVSLERHAAEIITQKAMISPSVVEEAILKMSTTSLAKLKDLVSDIITVRRREQDSRSYIRQKQYRENRIAKLEKEVFPYLEEFCKNTLKPGDWVRFEGTRNPKLFRQVVSVNSYSVYGLCVYFNRKTGLTFTGNSSENCFKKLSHVYNKDEKRWMDRKEIIKIVKDGKQN